MIPGVETVHPRESWQNPAWPVVGPPVDAADIDTAVIHYTAADDLIDGDPGESADDLPQYMRNMQYAYAKPKALGGRGYSLGYRWAVDWLGGVWQIRGWDIKSAANAGHNDHTEPILVLVDGNDPATDEAARSVRCIIAESQRRSGRPFTIVGHGQLAGASTSCPGVGLRAQITAGVFVPHPPTTTDEVDMIAIDYKPNTPEWTALTYTGTHLAHVVNSHADGIIRRAGVQRQTVTDAELDGLIGSATTTTVCPPEWDNTPRGDAWSAQRG